MAENTEIASSPRKQENKSILSLLPKFQLNLPFFFNQQPKKAEETVVSKGTAKTSTVSEADDGNASSVKPSLARFPDATRPILPPPIELEAEEPAGRTSNPVVLWQVRFLASVPVWFPRKCGVLLCCEIARFYNICLKNKIFERI